MLLPAELIDHIFSFLQSDISSLKACSKAHPFCSRLAERHLYAHIDSDSELEYCNNILETPHLLDYPRTLKVKSHFKALAIPFLSVIPRMANLVSLKIFHPFLFYQRDEFFSALRNCLQQSSFQELHLFHFHHLPSSILDDARNIKHLELFNCIADEDEPISSSPSSQLSLNTFILSSDHNPYLLRWAVRWVTRLTSLQLHYIMLDLDWTAFPELLVACSSSLTRFHIDISNRCYNTNREKLRFTLSTLKRLEELSVSALIIRNQWALPEIIRFVNTAPAIPYVVLQFHCFASHLIGSLGQLNWSLLEHLQDNSTGKRPRIDLCVTRRETMPESVLDALATNEALMNLVKRGLVTLRSERD